MAKNTRLSMLLSISLLCSLWAASSARSANVTIRLITSPLNVTTIDIGSSVDPIIIMARTQQKYVQSSWRIEGPGNLREQEHPYRIAYIPPDSIDQVSPEALITFAVTDDEGVVHEQSVTFLLRNSKQPVLPTVTPTPSPIIIPTPSPTPMPTVPPTPMPTVPPTPIPTPTATPTPRPRDTATPSPTVIPTPQRDACRYAVKRGDVFLRLVEAFTGSSGDRLYALASDVQAFNRLMSGDIQIGQIIQFPKDVLLPQYQSCQFVMPTPTPTPTPRIVVMPTSTPAPIKFASCPDNPDDVNTLLTASLPDALAEYQSLKDQEQSGQSVNDQLIAILDVIRCDLLAVEDILRKHYGAKQDDAVRERLERIEATRGNYERELRVRQKTEGN